MARPSDREYTLRQKIKELEDQSRKKDVEIDILKKKLDKIEKKSEDYVPKRKSQPTGKSGCPKCGSALKESELPFGTMVLCSDACGYREIKRLK